MSNPEMPVSTTNDLPGWRIITHIDLVTGHIVAGTGLFSDIFAGISDTFGGRSKSYQNQLSAICKEIVQQLTEKASHLGANAVVGLRLDYSDISGQGKSMLMVSGSGTAVRAELVDEDAINILNKLNKDTSQTKGKWICRCGAENDIETDKCTKCKRAMGAIY